MAQSLFASTKGDLSGPLTWTEQGEQTFNNLKQVLINAPALTRPNLAKSFQLHMAESYGIMKGVLTQYLGPWKRLVAYLSWQLDPTAAGWPNCLQTIAATAMLTKQTSKLTLVRDPDSGPTYCGDSVAVASG